MPAKNSPTIWIVCNANEITGLGHLMRCISLSRCLQSLGQSVQFYGDFSSKAQELLNHWGLSFSLDGNPISILLQTLPSKSLVVLDSYQYVSADLNPEHFYVLIDDFCRLNTYRVSGVINFTLMSYLYDYKTKGAASTALGLEYFLPNPALTKPTIRFQTTINNVLILIGSGDKMNLIPKILNALNLIQQPLSLRVMTAKGVELKSHHALDIQPIQTNIDPHYRWADLCITSGGLAKYEAAYLGKPAAVISLNATEQGETENFAKAHLCFNFGLIDDFDGATFAKEFEILLHNNVARHEAFKACQKSFYADSCDRAARFVCDCFNLRAITEV